MPRSPGSSESDQEEQRFNARLMDGRDVAAYRCGQASASLGSDVGQKTPKSRSKRKTDSPHNSQAKVASGESPSVQLQDTPSATQNKRSTMIGISDRLASLQTDGAKETEEPAPMTWHKNPFERPGARSANILSAASRLKKALRVSYERAEARGIQTSDKQRLKYERATNLSDVLVALGPADALALLDAVESAGGKDMSATAATMVAAILERARYTSTASGPYVSGALGKLTYCGSAVKSAATSQAGTAADIGHLEVAAAERTDMTRFPVMFGGIARPTSGGTNE